MQVLTDAEIKALNFVDLERIDYETYEVDQSSVMDFARYIEAAILAKLDNVELPEPEYYVKRNGRFNVVHKFFYDTVRVDELKQTRYTPDQLTAWGNTRYAQGAASQLAEKPSGYLSQYNLEMLQQGYPQTIVMLEGAKRDVALYTRREA